MLDSEFQFEAVPAALVVEELDEHNESVVVEHDAAASAVHHEIQISYSLVRLFGRATLVFLVRCLADDDVPGPGFSVRVVGDENPQESTDEINVGHLTRGWAASLIKYYFEVRYTLFINTKNRTTVIVTGEFRVDMSRPEIDESREPSMKAQRLDYPSGWLYLCKDESVHFMIDALLQVDPRKEFTQTELAEFAGVSTQSVRRHVDRLVELGVVAETAGGRRYHYDVDSPVGRLVAELNAEINAVGAGRAGPEDG